MFLKETIVSFMNPDTVYGLAGEEVTLVADYGKVLIVEGSKERFPVNVLMVTDRRLNPVVDTKPIINQVPAPKKAKAVSVPKKQTNLLL